MIPTKSRENRRLKALKLPKNLERRYKEAKCRECTVVVTRMDFAKILGKFTKVKIQYESNRSKRPTNQVSPNTRLKSNENGMVEVHRSAYNAHPAQKLLGTKVTKNSVTFAQPTSNVLKENNRQKKSDNINNSGYTNKNLKNTKLKQYGIVFENPTVVNNDAKSELSLQDLIPNINQGVLPSEEWDIDYFPKNGEPKDDKVYDKIAAELEDLMYNGKETAISEVKEDKTDEFPSIMDILNDNTKDANKNDQTNTEMVSNDVEAMLLGTSEEKPSDTTPMDIDNTDVSSFLTDVPSINRAVDANITDDTVKNDTQDPSSIEDNPESPSILNVTESTVIEAQVDNTSINEIFKDTIIEEKEKTKETSDILSEKKKDGNVNVDNSKKMSIPTSITQVIFNKNVNGTCLKSVICPKNLKYNISILGKSIELLGAPKYISSLEDLKVLLQIVDESELDNVYVLH